MNLYDKIEKLYKQEGVQKQIGDSPKWMKEILVELKEIKELLKTNTNITKKADKNLMSFVAEFRIKMKPNIEKNYFPDIDYGSRRLGVDNRGLLYDKKTLKILPREEAFSVYRYFYEKHIQENV